MKKLKGFALGLLMVLVVALIERELQNAAERLEQKVFGGVDSSGHRSPHQLLSRKEGTMSRYKRSFIHGLMWYVNIALLVVFLALLTCSACSPIRRDEIQPTPVVAVSPLVQNNFDFLFYAIAEKANLEASFCMLGKVNGETAYVHRITPVWVDSASGSELMHRPVTCTDSATIGVVHFHPGVGFCDLSDIDIVSAHYLRFPTTAIVCRENSDSAVKLVMVFRKEIDEEWWRIQSQRKAGDTTKYIMRNFTPQYRYRRPH